MTRLKVSKKTEKYLKKTGSKVLYDLFTYKEGKSMFEDAKEAFKELEKTDAILVNLVYNILTGKVTVYSSVRYILTRNIITYDYGDGVRDIIPLYWREEMPTLEHEGAQVLDEEEDKLLISVLFAQGWEKKEVYNY